MWLVEHCSEQKSPEQLLTELPQPCRNYYRIPQKPLPKSHWRRPSWSSRSACPTLSFFSH